MGDFPRPFLKVMEKLKTLSEKFSRLSVLDATQAAFGSGSVQDEALHLNKSQLNEGNGAQGQQLRTYKSIYPNVYTAYTINEKIKKGQPINRVTLKDTGKFQSMMKVEAFPGHASILADTKKPEGDMNDNIEVSTALGVTPDNMPKLLNVIIPEILKDMRTSLGI